MQEFSNVFVNVIENISSPFWEFLWVLGFFIAFIWSANIIWRYWRGNIIPGATVVSIAELLSVMIISSLLANYSSFLNTISHSLGLGDADFSPIAYIDEGGDLGSIASIINSAMTFAALMGGVYGIKGLILLYKSVNGQSGSGQDFVWKSVVHIVFGGLLVQISNFISAAANTAY
ncbi:conjugal transfer protein TraQ [Xenorhabdus nematophila]|uniref:conjugal transfer protein TraQ n=1 Tax=Xenorhabdus nematophila TaxID=628 RepID=UPI0032B709F6